MKRKVSKTLSVFLSMGSIALWAQPSQANSNGVNQSFIFDQDWQDRHGGAEPGSFTEIFRTSQPPTPGHQGEDADPDAQGDEQPNPPEIVPSYNSLDGKSAEFEITQVSTGRRFIYQVDRQELRKAARAAYAPSSAEVDDLRVSNDQRQREDDVMKAWSNSFDSRVRRSSADGWNVNQYAMMADYGGCSAIIVKASLNYMWALTAAHCVFTDNAGTTSSANVIPRRDETRSGSDRRPYGEWSLDAVGSYPGYLDNDCETLANYDNDCIKHDIALIGLVPLPGADVPNTMTWGYANKGYLNDHDKYRRGYPSCGNAGSPTNSDGTCTSNTLYGDGSLDLGTGFKLADGWYRIFRHSSDMSVSDSGSGLYWYEEDDLPVVLGVNTSGRSNCFSNCDYTHPNKVRRIDPIWYDFMGASVGTRGYNDISRCGAFPAWQSINYAPPTKVVHDNHLYELTHTNADAGWPSPDNPVLHAVWNDLGECE